MGLFKFFVKVTEEVPKYEPWNKSKGNSSKAYLDAVFLNALSFKAAPVGNKPDDYPRYAAYELNINDPIKKHKEFIKNGLMRPATTVEVLDTYKVADLKSILDKRGLSVKGKKAELITYIVENISPDDLNIPSMYCVSEKGCNFMAQYEDFIMLHGNPYHISYEEYINAKSNANPALRFNDIIWGIFNQRELSFALNDYGAKRNNALHRGMFLRKENRLIDALYHFIQVLFYDINEPSFDYDEIIPYIKEQIFELKEHYTLEMVHRCYANINLPRKIPQKAFEYVLNEIFQGN